jgi:hypothetical protein
MPRNGVALYDRATGKSIDFASPEEATSALDSGAFAPKKSDDVPVVSPEGTIGTVKGADLEAARKSGFQIATQRQHRMATYESAIKLPKGVVDAMQFAANQGIAATSGATAGLSDLALAKALASAEGRSKGPLSARIKATAEYLRDYREEHPIATTVGEVGGATAGALAGGAAGAGGKAASGITKAGVRLLPSAGIDALGGAAEAGVARALGTGTSALGRAGITGAKLAARGAVESGIYSGIHEGVEEELGGHEINAEKIFAATAKGALYGAAAGFGLGSVGSLAASGMKGLAKVAAPAARTMAEEQAVRAFNPSKMAEKRIARLPGGETGLGRYALDEGVHAFGGKATDAEAKVAALFEREAGALDNFYAKADASAFKAPALEGVVKRIDDEVVSKLMKLENTNSGSLNAVKNLVEDMATAKPKTFTEWRAFRAQVDDLIKWNPPAVGAKINPTQEAYKGIRNVIRDEIAEAGERSAVEAGKGGFKTELEALNKRFRYASALQELADDAAVREASNRAISLTDTIAGGGGFMGGMAQGPVGAVSGLALGAANKAVRERGSASLAVALDKVAGYGAIKQTVEAVDQRMAAGVRGMLSDTPQIRLKTAAANQNDEPLASRFRKAVGMVSAAQANPEAMINEHAERSRAVVGVDAPKTQAAYAMTLARANAYLASKLPAQPQSGTSIMPKPLDRISDAQKAEFMRHFDAVNDPITSIDGIAQGKVSRTQVEALKATAPLVYEQMRLDALEQVAQREAEGKPLGYAQRQRLHVLLDITTDWSNSPEGLRALQSNATQGKKPDASGGSAPTPNAPRRPVKIQTPESALDRIEAGA